MRRAPKSGSLDVRPGRSARRPAALPSHLLACVWAPAQVLKMKKFNFRKVLDGLTASSLGSGSSSSSNSGGTGSGPLHPGGTAGVLREEIQETLTSEYFQICKEYQVESIIKIATHIFVSGTSILV